MTLSVLLRRRLNGNAVTMIDPVVGFGYRRPDGLSYYFRPDGTSNYKRP